MSARGERASSPASTTRRIWPPLSWSMRRFARRRIQADGGQRLRHPSAVTRREPGRRSDLQIDAAAHQLQAGRLERDGHGANLIRYRRAVEQAAAGGRDGESRHDPRQRRLAGTVEAVDQQSVALVDGEGDVAQRRCGPGCSAAVFVVDAVEFEHGRFRSGGQPPPSPRAPKRSPPSRCCRRRRRCR